jgi:hypothetical protein
MNYNARIFITYHKPSKLLNGFNCVTPIHGGRVLRTATKDGDIHISDIDWLLHNTIGDDSGENISKKNREYCELTSLYWVYKNYDLSQCSHVGFMQYRRHFIFKEDEFSKSKNDFEAEAFSIKRYKTINPDYINAVGLTEGKILEYIHNYDCIIPYYGNLARAGVDSIWLDYAQQIPGLHIDDLCSLRKVFSEKFPEDLKLFDEYLSQPKKLMYLMFILRKDIFMDYCRFLFDTLFSVERKIDSSLYTLNGRRTMGFLGEILYGYYFAKLKRNYQLKVKELGVSLVMDTGV